MLINKTLFESYQKTFFNKCKNSPYTVTLVTYKAEIVEGTIEAFVGDSERVIDKTFELPCLYEKIVHPRQREKYGLPETVDGTIYLSPLQLVPLIGVHTLDKNLTKVIFHNRDQVINTINYLEEMFDTCVALQIALVDSLKGG